MDRREGFHAAVIKLRSPEWSPAFPDMNTLNVDGEYWTIRQVCELLKDDDEVLPDEIVGELMDAMHGSRRLLESFGRSRTYATGSQCLLELLDNLIKTFQKTVTHSASRRAGPSKNSTTPALLCTIRTAKRPPMSKDRQKKGRPSERP
jgi:hypothetical protein